MPPLSFTKWERPAQVRYEAEDARKTPETPKIAFCGPSSAPATAHCQGTAGAENRAFWGFPTPKRLFQPSQRVPRKKLESRFVDPWKVYPTHFFVDLYRGSRCKSMFFVKTPYSDL